ncbi:MAG: hypothetical protein WKF84_18435, partial [Pyrinomonadaceae bacterium]
DHKYWTAADLQPYIDHVIESFGWDQVMFRKQAGRYVHQPPLTNLAGDALARLTQSNNIPEEREKLFSGNAGIHYRLL